MKFNLKLVTAIVASSMLAGLNVANAAMSLEERVEELEIERALNTFKMSGFLLTQYDSIETDTGSAKSSEDWHRMRGALDFSAKPFENVDVYGRLTFIKYLNSLYGAPGVPAEGVTISRKEFGPMAQFEKLYFDYNFHKYATFSAGRFPTVDGTPYHYKFGGAKMGTYPRLAYNTVLDGYALTLKPGELFGQDLSVRVIYQPISFPTVVGPTSFAQALTNANALSTTSNLFALMVEYNSGQTSWAQNLNATILNLKSGKFYTSDVIIDPVTPVTLDASNFNFSFDNLTLHVDAANIMNSNVNLSVTHYMNSLKSEGGIDATNLGMPGTFLGLGGLAGETVDGSGTLISATYRTPWELIVGAEYLTSDKNYQLLDYGSDNLSDFYGTKGTATHFWLVFPFENTLSLTVGHRNQDYSHVQTLRVFGPSSESDKTITTTYANLRLGF